MARVFKLLALFIFAGASWAASLPKPVEQALKQAGVPTSQVSVLVQEAGGSRTSLSFNAGAPFNPASVMKIITTYAALEQLGPAYRWKTEVYQDGDDLVLRGTGDPKLNHESFWMLLRNLRGRGLSEIKGDIVLDRTHFAPIAAAPFDDDVYRPYNVSPDALLVNFKSVRFAFLPDYERSRVRVYAEPALPGLEIVNTLRLTDGGCPEGRAFRERIQASFQPSPPRASFTGFYPVSCGERDTNVALYNPEAYIEAMIRQLWAEMGGSWKGRIREGAVAPTARLLYTHDSEPLAEIVRDINKFSSNVMARQLYLTLAAELVGAPAQAEEAAAAIRQFLEKKGVRAPELVLENGSGLSRVERASAATIAAVLQAAWKSALMPEFAASLPLLGADGTLRKRMKNERVTGRAHMKTGLLVDARSMAGYVLDRHGRRQVVVMVANHPRAPDAEAAFDALLLWVYDAR